MEMSFATSQHLSAKFKHSRTLLNNFKWHTAYDRRGLVGNVLAY